MSAGNGHHHMMGPQDSPRKVKEQHMMVVPSPGTPRRHTKLKMTGATQTNSGVMVQGAEQLSVFTSPSPQRSVSSLGMQGVSGRLLSDTTKVCCMDDMTQGSYNPWQFVLAINKYLPFCTKYKHSSCHKTPILCRRGFLHLRGGHPRRLVTL